MDNHNYPEGSDTSGAPWNEPQDVSHKRFVSVTISYYDTVDAPEGVIDSMVELILTDRAFAGEFPKKFDVDEIVILKD